MIDDPNPSGGDAVPTTPDGFDVTQDWVDQTVVVSVSGAVDMLTAPLLKASINTAAAQAPSCVIVDLTTVDFLGSAGMGALVAAHSELTPAARFAVVADGPSTSRPLKLIGIDTLIPLYRTLDEALTGVADD